MPSERRTVNLHAFIASTLAVVGIIILMVSWSHFVRFKSWRRAAGWFGLVASTAAAALCIGLAVLRITVK